jgi:hypothetical protein
MNWRDYYNLPVVYRKWLIDRVSQEIKKSVESGEQPMPSKGTESFDPTLRSAMNKRPHTPQSLKRF